MFRKIAATTAISLAALGIALTAPATATADPDIDCTATGTVDTPKIDWNGSTPVVVGTYHANHVGDRGTLFGTLRVWHVTLSTGSNPAAYDRAYAARCQSDGTKTNEIDLTRTPDQALSEFDQRCGATGFTQGSTSYQFMGHRSSGLFKPAFRYWSTASTTNFLVAGVTAARCPWWA